MMLIDEREPIEEMQILLRPHGKDVYSQHLDFGDSAFDGYGPRGVVLVGVERKRIDDIVNSIHSGRRRGRDVGALLDELFVFDFSEERAVARRDGGARGPA